MKMLVNRPRKNLGQLSHLLCEEIHAQFSKPDEEGVKTDKTADDSSF